MNQSTKSASLWIFTTILLIGAVLAGQIHRTSMKPVDLSSLGFFSFETPRGFESAPLQSVDGSPYSLAASRDSWTIIFFGFTYCPDVCPTTLSILNLAVDGIENPPGVVMITVDPERDTPTLVDRYTRAFNPAFVGLTGRAEDIRKIADQFGIAYQKTYLDNSEDYLVDHSGVLVVLNPAGEHAGYIRPPLNPENIRKIILEIMDPQHAG